MNAAIPNITTAPTSSPTVWATLVPSATPAAISGVAISGASSPGHAATSAAADSDSATAITNFDTINARPSSASFRTPPRICSHTAAA